jgi:hypothetical protein
MFALCAERASLLSFGHALFQQLVSLGSVSLAWMLLIFPPEMVTVIDSVPRFLPSGGTTWAEAVYVPAFRTPDVGLGVGVGVGFVVVLVGNGDFDVVGLALADGFRLAVALAWGPVASPSPGGTTTAPALTSADVDVGELPSFAPTSRAPPVRVPRTKAAARRIGNSSG